MKVIDKQTGFTEEVVNTTATSWEITQKKITDKGIDCTQWFDMTLKVNKERFQIIN